MELIVFLVCFPALIAACMLLMPSNKGRTALAVGGGVVIMAAAIALAVVYLPQGPVQFSLSAQAVGAEISGEQLAQADVATWVTYLTLAVSVIVCLYIIVKGARAGKPIAIFMAAIQLVLVLVLEFAVAHEVEIDFDLYLDQFSIIMALIIGVIGSGICIYAVGYMRDFQAHAEKHKAPPAPGSPQAEVGPGASADGRSKDRRRSFFALMFVFLSAMFLIVFSNNLTWLLCGWEVTTVCSFALIGYTRTREATDNAFRQIAMNLLGGLAFVIALILLGEGAGVLELDKLIALGASEQGMGLAALPILLIALAGFTKAAQVPFQSWLLGAMVAPTPTSALLHSSTMVKAGVFILIKLAPTFGYNTNGMMVVLVGGVTFLACSALAISQSNAKRVLAYSTVANLGLIVACAGVGTPEATWAAIFLLIFHAAAKSLLFLCVGTAEHHIHSRDIEDMDELFAQMPRLAVFMALGMLAMFIAPFGMLVSKWATIVSLVQTGNVLLLFILAFGSALTFMFWAKWLGKVLAIAQGVSNLEKSVHRSEWASIGLMAVISAACSVGLPWLSQFLVVPYLVGVAESLVIGGSFVWLSVESAIGFGDLLIMSAISLLLVLVLLGVLVSQRFARGNSTVYLSGIGTDHSQRSFKNSLSGETVAAQRNWYLEAWFGEERLTSSANIVSITLVVLGFILAFAGIGGVL